ncbi:MAG: pyruvate kinase, partial [Deltaproteobacteria bacterium]|nr:pyruvate kinase [Deltaproteobacteria bacterium]
MWTPEHPFSAPQLRRLHQRVIELRDSCRAVEIQRQGALEEIPPDARESARNLLHYVALRGQDLRDLQDDLAELGLSSLGRAESHVEDQLDAVAFVLARLAGATAPAAFPPDRRLDGGARLRAATERLFGPAHSPVILVTAPSADATDASLLRALLDAGMGCLRINCAHEDAAAWQRTAETLRRTAADAGVHCSVLFDLPGPKLRTGPVPVTVGRGGALRLFPGDDLVLVGGDVPATGPSRDRPASVGCAAHEVVRALRPGDPVYFDDGKIGCEVVRTEGDRAWLRVVKAKPGGSKLRAERGINAPASPLELPLLAPQDHQALDVAARHADMVGLSFVRSVADVRQIRAELDARGAPGLGLLLKIETLSGFEQLPNLLLEGLRQPRLGVMIARGDLAVECGFERLAEQQEEILWLSEAAHVPVV